MADAAAAAAAANAVLRGDVRSGVESISLFSSNKFGGDFDVITGSDNSFKHVAGVSKRKSHGWSYPITGKFKWDSCKEIMKKKKQ